MSVHIQAYPSSQILEAIRVCLKQVLELDDSMVRLVANDEYQVSFEGTLIAIRPIGPSPFVNAGGGRGARPVSRTIRVYLHKRQSLDFVGDDKIVVAALCDLEDEVLNALDDWAPLESTGTKPMTIEPLHPIDSSGGPPVRQASNDIGECFSRLDFEIRYVLINETPKP